MSGFGGAKPEPLWPLGMGKFAGVCVFVCLFGQGAFVRSMHMHFIHSPTKLHLVHVLTAHAASVGWRMHFRVLALVCLLPVHALPKRSL